MVAPQPALQTGVLVDVFDARGSLIAAGREVVDLRRFDAGTYFLRAYSATADGAAAVIPADGAAARTRDFKLSFIVAEQGRTRAIYEDFDRDRIEGGDGNDTIIGGPDFDRISGGMGTDRFVSDRMPAPFATIAGVEIRDREAAETLDGFVSDPPTTESAGQTKPGRIDREIPIPDKGLRLALARALAIPVTTRFDGEPLLARSIRASDMASLLGFDASNRGIEILDGLEYAVNLRWLDLSHNRIGSVERLAPGRSFEPADAGTRVGPRQIVALSLDDNRIRSLEPLSLLTDLRELSVDDNRVVSVGPLAGLKNLRSLSADRQYGSASAGFDTRDDLVGWSVKGATPAIVTSTSGATFLGENSGGAVQRFGNDTVSLALGDFDAGTLTLTFDLYTVGTWSGVTPIWSLVKQKERPTAAATTLVQTSFATGSGTANYPAPTANNGGSTSSAGAAAGLGYAGLADAKYSLTLTVVHPGGSLGFDFAVANLLGTGTWGLDNVATSFTPARDGTVTTGPRASECGSLRRRWP